LQLQALAQQQGQNIVIPTYQPSPTPNQPQWSPWPSKGLTAQIPSPNLATPRSGAGEFVNCFTITHIFVSNHFHFSSYVSHDDVVVQLTNNLFGSIGQSNE
jgi:hypothetical protein